MTEAEQAIATAKAKLPMLCGHGMMYPRVKIDCSGFNVDGVATAIEFLKQCGRTKQPRWSSYYLKHAAERWGRTYVANGELIVAAVFLDFPYQWNGESPNVVIGVAKKDVERLDPVSKHQR